MVTGGSSLIQGLTDRINYEMQNMYPGPRVRLQAAGNVVERKYAGWIGGSILASLGSFHQVSCCGEPRWERPRLINYQMWISKKEYDEHGPGIVEKRCK